MQLLIFFAVTDAITDGIVEPLLFILYITDGTPSFLNVTIDEFHQ
jgi:hypothetical protein